MAQAKPDPVEARWRRHHEAGDDRNAAVANLATSFGSTENLQYLKELLSRPEIQQRVKHTGNAVRQQGGVSGVWDLRQELEALTANDRADVLTCTTAVNEANGTFPSLHYIGHVGETLEGQTLARALPCHSGQ